MCVKNDEASTIETRIEIPESIDAPIANKQEAGHLIILLNGQEIGKISLLADKDYEKAGFFERLKGIVSFWK